MRTGVEPERSRKVYAAGLLPALAEFRSRWRSCERIAEGHFRWSRAA
jgi:hypothetical protein